MEDQKKEQWPIPENVHPQMRKFMDNIIEAKKEIDSLEDELEMNKKIHTVNKRRMWKMIHESMPELNPNGNFSIEIDKMIIEKSDESPGGALMEFLKNNIKKM